MTNKIIEINADKFEDEVLKGDKVVVDFYSTECPPCEALATKFDSLSELYGNDIKFVKVFRQGNRDLATTLGVTGSPTLLFYDNGERTGDTLAGAVKRSDIMRNLDALIDSVRVEEIHNQIKPIETECEVIVLGGGPAGLTAGLYLAQAHNDVILVDTQLPGGYVATTHQVSNYPGFIDKARNSILFHGKIRHPPGMNHIRSSQQKADFGINRNHQWLINFQQVILTFFIQTVNLVVSSRKVAEERDFLAFIIQITVLPAPLVTGNQNVHLRFRSIVNLTQDAG